MLSSQGGAEKPGKTRPAPRSRQQRSRPARLRPATVLCSAPKGTSAPPRAAPWGWGTRGAMGLNLLLSCAAR